MHQRRDRKGKFVNSDHQRRSRQPKRTAEQEMGYVSMLTLKAISEGRAFSAKVLGREVATLGYKVIGRGL